MGRDSGRGNRKCPSQKEASKQEQPSRRGGWGDKMPVTPAARGTASFAPDARAAFPLPHACRLSPGALPWTGTGSRISREERLQALSTESWTAPASAQAQARGCGEQSTPACMMPCCQPRPQGHQSSGDRGGAAGRDGCGPCTLTTCRGAGRLGGRGGGPGGSSEGRGFLRTHPEGAHVLGAARRPGRDPWESLCFLPQPLPGETPAEVVVGGPGSPPEPHPRDSPAQDPDARCPEGSWERLVVRGPVPGPEASAKAPHWPDRSCSGESPGMCLAGREGEHKASLSRGSRAGGTVDAARGRCKWRLWVARRAGHRSANRRPQRANTSHRWAEKVATEPQPPRPPGPARPTAAGLMPTRGGDPGSTGHPQTRKRLPLSTPSSQLPAGAVASADIAGKG